MSEPQSQARGAPECWTLRRGEPGYPECLESTPRPPASLHGYGDPGLLRPGLAIVGARRATPYGVTCARMFARRAAELGVVVVSGAAIGCDSAAHAAAMDAGGSTVAVLGCGADVDYPASARRSLERMRAEHVVISEQPWGSPPARWTFPERNRLIAGLSAAVLIVEAALGSGTAHTAAHALDAGRDVLAVPASIFFDGAAGCNRLIADGATPIASERDLDDALAGCGLIDPLGATRTPCAEDKAREPAGEPASSDPLLDALLAQPMRPDDLAEALSVDLVACVRRLTELEYRGAIARYPDGRYGPP